MVDRLIALTALSGAFTPAAVLGALPPVLISVTTVLLVFQLVSMAFAPVAPAPASAPASAPAES